jgi:PAS domain S-box-containing protein
VLLVLPMLQDAVNAASDGRQRQRGLVFSPLVLEELLAGLAETASGQARIELFDSASGTPQGPLLYDSRLDGAARAAAGQSHSSASSAPSGSSTPRYEIMRTVDLPGRLVTMRASSTPGFEAEYSRRVAWLIGLGGLLASGLLAALLRQQVTSRSRAEARAQQLTAELSRLAMVAQRTNNAVVIADTQRLVTWVNEGFERITGYGPSEAVGQSPGRLLQSERTDPATVLAMQVALDAGRGFRGEVLNRGKSGAHYWVDLDIQPLHDDSGQPIGFMSIETDITERKLAEAALRASQDFLEQTGRIGGVGGWSLDIETQALQWSDETCRIHDLEPGHQPTLQEATAYYAADAQQTIQHAVEAGIANGQGWDLELPLVTARGRPIWVRAVGAVDFLQGKPVRLFGAFQDITARREMEAELRAKNELVNSILENLPCGLSVFDSERRLLASNRQFRRLLDLPDGLVERPTLRFEDLIRYNAERGEYGLGDVDTRVRDVISRAWDQHQPHQFERRRQDGTTLEVRGAPMPGGGLVTTYTDISTRKAAETEAQRSAALLRGAIDAIDEAFILFDPDDRMVFCNDKYRQMYASRAHQFVPGATFEEIVRPGAEAGDYLEALGRVDEWVAQRVAAHRSANTTLVQPLANGRTLRIMERKLPDGHIVGFRVDITELVRSKQAAEQASIAKSQFLANMSHEIRTPMNAILGMLTLLRKSGLNSRQADYAEKTEGAARSLLGLLNDILDFSKVEAGKMTLDPHPFRFDQLLRDLGVILGANAGAKPLEVLFDIDPDVPRELVGDAMRLQQVLINLAGNAIKFTPAGEVVVSVRVPQRSEREVTLHFAVRDTGIGIAPENQARIFSGFTQAEASTTRRYGGTGLGVAISQRLVGLMGGELKLDSTLGRGTTFHFVLTLPVVPGSAAQTQRPDRLPAPHAALHALLVDDNATAREVLRDMARNLGWTADVADSGEAALALLAQRTAASLPTDAVFVDGQMAGLDGWQTAARMRSAGLIAESPVVLMVTAQDREGLEAGSTAEQRPVDGILVKPVTAPMLLDALAAARQGRVPLLPSAVDGAAAADRAGVPRLCGLRLLVTEDNPNNQQVAKELLEGEGAIVQIANNGQEGVEAVAAAAPPFDVVLMDLQMPVMDGFTATRRIRQDLGLTDLPIVAMTANAMASDRAACLEAGMSEHVGKPFDLDHLVALLLRVSGRGEPRRTAAAEPVPSTDLPADLMQAAMAAGVDLVAALQRMGGKKAVFTRLLRHGLPDFETLPDRLNRQLASGQTLEAGRSLHTLKGVAATLGATAVAAHAGAAERALADAHTPALRSSQADAAHTAMAALQAALPPMRTLLALLEADAATDRPAGVLALEDPAALHAALASLCTLLQNFDMGATEWVGRLRLQASPVWDAQLQVLEDAVGTLDFERATPLCEQLLALTQP